jgi:hypothetical protein
MKVPVAALNTQILHFLFLEYLKASNCHLFFTLFLGIKTLCKQPSNRFLYNSEKQFNAKVLKCLKWLWEAPTLGGDVVGSPFFPHFRVPSPFLLIWKVMLRFRLNSEKVFYNNLSNG